jgi:hypothetical protein
LRRDGFHQQVLHQQLPSTFSYFSTEAFSTLSDLSFFPLLSTTGFTSFLSETLFLQPFSLRFSKLLFCTVLPQVL